MRKTFNIEIDCAVCAGKVEDAVKKLPEVSFISVNYITQKMTIETADDCFDGALKKVVKLAKKIEPDFEILN